MSKKKAQFYNLDLLSKNRPHATINFFDHKERCLLSSVDVVLNLEYYDQDSIWGFVTSR